MAKSKNAYKQNDSSGKKTKKKKGTTNLKRFTSFFKDERLHKSIGLLFILFSFYLVILFGWKKYIHDMILKSEIIYTQTY